MKFAAAFRFPLFAVAMLGLAIVDASAAGEVVGKLGSVELTAVEARKSVDVENTQAKLQFAASQANLDRFVRTLLVRKVVLAEALAAGWDKRPEVLEAIEQAKQRIVASAYLSDKAKVPEGFPTDAEVDAFYKANPAQLTAPRRYRIAQIFVSAPNGADPARLAAAKKRIEEMAASIRSGADFAKLAQSGSEDTQSAPRGGEVGWMAENQLAPEIRTAVSALARDQVSSPIKMVPGWHLVKLIDSRPAALRPLDEVRDAIAAALRANRVRENATKYADEIARNTPPEINQVELAKLWKSIH